MKKSVLLNAPVSGAISCMGHGDGLCVGDAGLPIPDGPERIDLAVSKGLPGMLGVASAVSAELQIERAVIASELADMQPAFHARLLGLIEETAKAQGSDIEVTAVSHEAFKALTQDCKAVVRTGECTPYANVIFYSGVTF